MLTKWMSCLLPESQPIIKATHCGINSYLSCTDSRQELHDKQNTPQHIQSAQKMTLINIKMPPWVHVATLSYWSCLVCEYCSVSSKFQRPILSFVTANTFVLRWQITWKWRRSHATGWCVFCIHPFYVCSLWEQSLRCYSTILVLNSL